MWLPEIQHKKYCDNASDIVEWYIGACTVYFITYV